MVAHIGQKAGEEGPSLSFTVGQEVYIKIFDSNLSSEPPSRDVQGAAGVIEELGSPVSQRTLRPRNQVRRHIEYIIPVHQIVVDGALYSVPEDWLEAIDEGSP